MTCDTIKSLDSEDIDRCLSFLKYYEGVYPCNKLPQVTVRPCLFVVNTDRADQKGEHWTVVLLLPDGKGEYMNSFGIQPQEQTVLDFLDTNSITWIFNELTLQSLEANTCGLYCIAYSILRAKGFSFGEFLSLFTDDPKINDARVRSLCKPLLEESRRYTMRAMQH